MSSATSRASLPVAPVAMPSAAPRPAIASRRLCQDGPSARPSRAASDARIAGPAAPRADSVPTGPPRAI